MSEPLQLLAQLQVVEDLAVEDDPEGLVLVGERLLAGGEIDDREPGVGQAGAAIAVGAELVGPAVAKRARQGGQLLAGRRRRPLAQRHHSGDPAHR
jgi:hypothetical protein